MQGRFNDGVPPYPQTVRSWDVLSGSEAACIGMGGCVTGVSVCRQRGTKLACVSLAVGPPALVNFDTAETKPLPMVYVGGDTAALLPGRTASLYEVYRRKACESIGATSPKPERCQNRGRCDDPSAWQLRQREELSWGFRLERRHDLHWSPDGTVWHFTSTALCCLASEPICIAILKMVLFPSNNSALKLLTVIYLHLVDLPLIAHNYRASLKRKLMAALTSLWCAVPSRDASLSSPRSRLKSWTLPRCALHS